MIGRTKLLLDRITSAVVGSPEFEFRTEHYLRYDARRLEHLASLRIPVRGLTVLEVGAGIGDNSHYYLDRGCTMTITEVRPVNLRYLRHRYPTVDIRRLDMELPQLDPEQRFDVIHCFGLLYHLRDPQPALEFFGQRCTKLLFLETCVSFGDEEAVNPIAENRSYRSQAVSGTGCRPTRPWLFQALKRRFEHVYVPLTQPNHEEFPIDWTAEPPAGGYTRAVFICSREPLNNELLCDQLLMRQKRHE